MATITDFAFVSTGGILTTAVGQWVRLRSIALGTDYFSTAVTDAQGSWTITAPPDDYQLYTGPAATVPGTPTLVDPHYRIGYSAGDDAALKSVTAKSSSPYAPNLPGATSVATPAGVTTGKVWDYGGEGWHVKAFNAKGDSVTDDTTAIRNTVTQANIAGGIVKWGQGGFVVTDYIDVQSGFTWIGSGWQAVGAVGTTITCKGGAAGKGILRFRPGAIGNESPTAGAMGYVEGISFVGDAATATTGHLVQLARCNNIRFRYCSFADTRGSGLKDDQTTAVAACAVYMYGTEQISFDLCQFSNCLNASGAALGYENGNHGHWFAGCHFLNNTYHVRFVGIGATPNGGVYFDGCFFITQVTTFRVEATGTANNVSCYGCWQEGATTNSVGCLADGSAAGGRLFNWTFVGCVLKGKTGTTFLVQTVAMDSSSFISCRFDTFSLVFANTFTNGGNVLLAPDANAVTAYFLGNDDPASSGFSFAAGTLTNPTGTKAITQTSVATSVRRIALADGANVNIDLSQGNDFFLSAAGSRTIQNPTSVSGLGYSQIYSVTIKNNTGGAITTTWAASYHLAGAWVDAATTKQRTVLLRWDATAGVNYEISRDAADVTP